MKKIIAIFAVLILGALGWRYFELKQAAPNASSDPKTVVTDFYAAWQKGDYKLGDRSYQKIPVWTPKLVSKVDSIVASFDQGGYDPVLCAQDLPESSSFSLDEQTASTARITVAEQFGPETAVVKVTLLNIDNKWLIDDISCGNGFSGDTAAQTQVGDYVRDNISALSPAKEVLGGKYYVTKITFGSENEALVEYEDGHIAHTAKFNFKLENGQVLISNFTILE